MVKVPKPFVQETLWPQYEQLSAALRTYMNEVTDRVIAATIHGDSSEPAEVAQPAQLASGAVNVDE